MHQKAHNVFVSLEKYLDVVAKGRILVASLKMVPCDWSTSKIHIHFLFQSKDLNQMAQELLRKQIQGSY